MNIQGWGGDIQNTFRILQKTFRTPPRPWSAQTMWKRTVPFPGTITQRKTLVLKVSGSRKNVHQAHQIFTETLRVPWLDHQWSSQLSPSSLGPGNFFQIISFFQGDLLQNNKTVQSPRLDSWSRVLGNAWDVLNSWSIMLGNTYDVLNSWSSVLGNTYNVLNSWSSGFEQLEQNAWKYIWCFEQLEQSAWKYIWCFEQLEQGFWTV